MQQQNNTASGFRRPRGVGRPFRRAHSVGEMGPRRKGPSKFRRALPKGPSEKGPSEKGPSEGHFDDLRLDAALHVGRPQLRPHAVVRHAQPPQRRVAAQAAPQRGQARRPELVVVGVQLKGGGGMEALSQKNSLVARARVGAVHDRVRANTNFHVGGAAAPPSAWCWRRARRPARARPRR